MQTKICQEMKVSPTIDVSWEIERRIDFIKQCLINSGLTSLVLGISGGQDSTLAGRLCQLAVEGLNQQGEEKYKLVAVRLPYKIQIDELDCQDALAFIDPDQIITYNISEVVDSHVNQLAAMGITISDFHKGNIKARERMVAQYAIAAAEHGLVVGTDHSAEAITGFYTKFGDGAADIAPLFGLNKRQGKMLLQHLGCPKHLYLKVPTADLEDDQPALADEVALGVTYNQIDDYLEGKQVENCASDIIESHYRKSSHKRNPVKTIYH
ncbi:ammonia-dependent NAD(+) synthetase [Mollicutes bacterium LVI A0039]|nr:ammonia-dependent NAD(+) synthetase [Mollicutes bacterium LVI A0039]